MGCGKFFVGISKFKTIAKIKNKISKISSHLLWEYDTSPSHDSDMTKSKMLSNITLFGNLATNPFLRHDNVMAMSYPTKILRDMSHLSILTAEALCLIRSRRT